MAVVKYRQHLSLSFAIGTKFYFSKVLNKLNSVALVHIAAHGQAKTGELFCVPIQTDLTRETFF